MKAKVLHLDQDATSDIELNDSIFGLEPRRDLLQRVVVWQLAKRRAGTHKVLTRGEINRTKRKVYRQKGTGQARHGARSAPLFVGGAKAMGPVQHSHAFDLPKKVRRGALRAAIAQKLANGTVIVVDSLASADRKTKGTAELLKRLGAVGKTLLIDVKPDDGFALSARNLAGVKFVTSARVTARDVSDTSHVVATREALEKLQESLG